MLRINIILLLLISVALFAVEKDSKKKDATSIILLDGGEGSLLSKSKKAEEKKEVTKKVEEKEEKVSEKAKEKKKKVTKEAKEKQEVFKKAKENTSTMLSNQKEEVLKKDEKADSLLKKDDDFVFTCKYCKLDNSLSNTLEFGLHLGSPIGIDVRYWITDFLGVSAMFGFDTEFTPYLNLDVTLSMIKLYQSNMLDIRADFGVAGMLTTGENGAGDTVLEGGIFFPMGVSFPFKENPINISLYYAPGVRLSSTSTSLFIQRFGLILNYSLGRANKLKENKQCLYDKVKELDKDIYFLKQKDEELVKANEKLVVKEKRVSAKNIIISKELAKVKKKNRKMLDSFKFITSENVKLTNEVESLKKDKGKLNVDIVVIKEEKKQLVNDKKILEKEKNEIIRNREKVEAEKEKLNQELKDFEKHKESISSLVDTYNKKEDLKFENACKLNNSKNMTFEAGIHASRYPGLDARFWFTNNIGIGTTLSVDFPELNKELNFLVDFDILFQYSIMRGKNIGFTFDIGLKTSIETIDFSNVGLYVPIGFSLPFYKSPIEISTYFAPGMNIKETSFDYKYGVLFNYSFGRAKRIKKYRKCLSDTVENLGLRVEDLKAKNKNLVHGNLWLRHEDEKLRDSKTSLEKNLKKEKSEKNKLNKALKEIERKEKQLKENMKKLENEKKNISSENDSLKDFKTKKAEYLEAEFRLNQEKKELEAKLKKEQEAKLKIDAELNKSKKTVIKYNEMKCTSTGGTFKKNSCSCPKNMKLSGNICVCKGSHQKFNTRANRCVCDSGYTKSKGKCKKCALTNFFGDCVTECFEPEVPWKGKCVCPESKNLIRDTKDGSCICKAGFNTMGDSCVEGLKK